VGEGVTKHEDAGTGERRPGTFQGAALIHPELDDEEVRQ
jgi:hypothetical protein